MKKSWQCPKCSSQRIGYLSELPETGHNARSRELGRTPGAGFLDSPVRASVEAFLCTECGYFEEYVKDPQRFDWNALPHFHWCTRQQQ